VLSGSTNPTLWPSCCLASHSTSLCGELALSARTRILREPRDRVPCLGGCANAYLMTVMWSSAVFDPACLASASIASDSPVPSGPWSTNAQRVEPEAVLDRRLGVLLLRVRGDHGGVHVDDQRRAASAPWSGARSPARSHALDRRAPRAACATGPGHRSARRPARWPGLSPRVDTAGWPDRAHRADIDLRPRVEPATQPHLKGAPTPEPIRPSTSRIFPGQEHLSSFRRLHGPPRDENPRVVPRSLTEVKIPRRIAWRSMLANQTSTRLSQDPDVGVK
jgi:hypothetical protein